MRARQEGERRCSSPAPGMGGREGGKSAPAGNGSRGSIPGKEAKESPASRPTKGVAKGDPGAAVCPSVRRPPPTHRLASGRPSRGGGRQTPGSKEGGREGGGRLRMARFLRENPTARPGAKEAPSLSDTPHTQTRLGLTEGRLRRLLRRRPLPAEGVGEGRQGGAPLLLLLPRLLSAPLPPEGGSMSLDG